MLSQDQLSQLKASFPQEALSADTSRGFELTSIKAAYVIERLNEVFGPCGAGWRYVHSSFEQMEGEVITEAALQYPVEGSEAAAIIWDGEGGGWAFLPNTSGWSWPVFASGGKRLGKGGAPLTDARKSAVTDGITKAASMIGVGHEVLKGLVRVGNERASSQHEKAKPAPNKEESSPANAQAFWKLANEALKEGERHVDLREGSESSAGCGEETEERGSLPPRGGLAYPGCRYPL